MECDEQDEGTVSAQFQDDSAETPTWLREEVSLGSYQQAAREGIVFAHSVFSQIKSDTYIQPVSIQPKLFQCPEGLHQHCRNKHKCQHFCIIGQASHSSRRWRSILNSINALSSTGESFVDLTKLQKFYNTNLQQTNCGWIRGERCSPRLPAFGVSIYVLRSSS